MGKQVDMVADLLGAQALVKGGGAWGSTSLSQSPMCQGTISSWDVVEHSGDKEEQGHPHASSPGQFDGRAQDPRTGRDYHFNSVTGARRWI
ncbi:hypothetical protein DV515_00013147 [Chloebia gouldiae]|uniref:Uncharacterized protein n=1 Tax=Chloebia gouldiae TaxID=44316 RepID=A0A3L8S1W1_CHLGU|nr:hypothetical protein DV515_00013147 [Chloebia gouldiae]